MTGAIIRHGPHHGAQNSTSTGVSLAMTRLSQLESVTACTWSKASRALQTVRDFWYLLLEERAKDKEEGDDGMLDAMNPLLLLVVEK
uniref:Thioredoxin mMitochondrial-type n=1 Tax=Rhizophora mucronata TaxID=61149 RepID=A0A2P2QUV3_RHIMU